jgi:hypothetical protein
MNEEITNLIIKELGRHRSRNELIRSVCEQGSLNWGEAERLIQQVEEQHKRTIAKRQSPILLLISFAMVAAGIVFFFYSIQFFIDFFLGETLDKLLSLPSGYYKLVALPVGLGMVIGGLIGVWKTLLTLFEE